MADLDLSPEFESALRAGLARLGDAAPVPDDAHLDALEHRSHFRPGEPPRGGRVLALAAAILLVAAAVIGALAVSGDQRSERPTGSTSTTAVLPTTSSSLLVPTTAVGPTITARRLSAGTVAVDPEDPPGAITMNKAIDQAELDEVWDLAGRAAADRPVIDFGTEVVVEVIADDHGCPSTAMDFQRGPTAVRAQVVEPASCADPLAEPVRRAFVYALPWSATGRPFDLDVYLPEEPSAFGSIPID